MYDSNENLWVGMDTGAIYKVDDFSYNIDRLSIGLDLYKPIYSSLNNDDLSYEIITSLRIFEDFSLASEIGSLDKYIEDENINFTSTGEYLKLGFDYNLFNNWTGMDNSIYLGVRFATSSFNKIIYW